MTISLGLPGKGLTVAHDETRRSRLEEVLKSWPVVYVVSNY